MPVAEVAFFYRAKPACADDETVFARGIYGPKRLVITLIRHASQTRPHATRAIPEFSGLFCAIYTFSNLTATDFTL